MGAAVLPSLLSLLLLVVVAAAGAAGAEDAMIRPAAAAANNKVLGDTTTLCCSNMTGYHECVEACLVILPPAEAVKYCDVGCKEAYQCQTVSGDECPSPSPSEHHLSSPDLVTADSAVVGEVIVVQEQVQAVGETLCCSNMTGFHECVEACFAILPRADAVKFCDVGCKEAYQCQTVSGDECPSEHHDSFAAKRDAAVDHCVLGCNSSVCSKMVTGVGRKGMVKHAVERYNNACYKFCNKQGVHAGTSTA